MRDDEALPEEFEDEGPSKSARKRDAHAAQKLGEKMYADQAQAAPEGGPGGAGGAGATGSAGPQAGSKPADDNVVDAEFTEVKDKK